MELWHSQYLGTGRTRESAPRHRILKSTSGNAQPAYDKRRSHLDFKKFAEPCHAVGNSCHQYVTPLPTLKSNAQEGFEGRTAQRKAKRQSLASTRLIHDRPYLQNDKYKEYRNRSRLDNGPDGKPVWPAYVEESFQTALVHIPPMGRNKKSQQGGLKGRNELIAEWILQDTGEERSRKQISSHIQVLSNIFKGDPDWKAVTVSDGANDQNNSPDFYFTSIADQVRLQRSLAAKAKLEAAGGDFWLQTLSHRYLVDKITFDMWVGSPLEVSTSLHDYTRLSCTRSPHDPAPLESCEMWRQKFPDLDPVLEKSRNEEFDIILMRSSISLTTTYPPQSSKLGLFLDLAFQMTNVEDSERLETLQSWTCISNFYHDGQKTRQTGLKSCSRDENGLIKLGFEADWWAVQFTDLVRKRIDAEGSPDDSAVAAIDAHSRSLLQKLTIMQEVFASPISVHAIDPASVPRKRMAVILWTFSQANIDEAGVTTWQKLHLPRGGRCSDSCTSEKVDTNLPSLGIDGMLDDGHLGSEMDYEYPEALAEPNMPLSPTVYEPSMYHSGLTPIQRNEDESMTIAGLGEHTGWTPQYSFSDLKPESFDFNAPAPVSTYYSKLQYDLVPAPIPLAYQLPSNDFQASSLPTCVNQCGEMPALPATSPQDRQQSLANFDMSTHQMLQAQLGPDHHVDDSYRGETPPDQQDTNSQASMTGYMHDLDLHSQPAKPSALDVIEADIGTDEILVQSVGDKAMIDHPSIFDTPRVVRPPLMTHNSFAGVLTSHRVIDTEQIVFDIPTRNDFDRLIANTCHQSSPGDLFGDSGLATVDNLDFSTDLMRPRSQPLLSSHEDDFHEISTQHSPHMTGIKTEQS